MPEERGLLPITRAVLAVIGVGLFLLSFDAALDVEEAYALVCKDRLCQSITSEIQLLKLCTIVASIAVPLGIGWFLKRLRSGG
jgi:hypothetical protein